MSQNGKGDTPRPLSVAPDTFAANFDRIFRKHGYEPEAVEVGTQEELDAAIGPDSGIEVVEDGLTHEPVPLRRTIWEAPDGLPDDGAIRTALWFALLVGLIGGLLLGRTLRAQAAVEATVRVSAEVVAAADPMAPEPEAPVRWVVEYPMPGRRVVFPEGL